MLYIIWLVPRAGKMTQIARCDWLPERASSGDYLARSGLPAVSRKKNFLESHIINPLLTKFVWSSLFGWVYGPRPRSINTQIKILGQYPAILTKQTWSIKDLLCSFQGNVSCGIQRVVCFSTSSRSINTQIKNLANIQPSWPHTWSITHTYSHA